MGLRGQKVQKPKSELSRWIAKYRLHLAILIIAVGVSGGLVYLLNQPVPPGPVQPTGPNIPFQVSPTNQSVILESDRTFVTFWNVTSGVLVQGVFNVTVYPTILDGQPINLTVTAWAGWINISPTVRTNTGRVLAYQPQTVEVSITLGETSCWVYRVGLVHNCITSGTFTLAPNWESQI